jgi:hypothetical protein
MSGTATGEGSTPTISVALNGLTTSTNDGDGDYFVVVSDGGGQRKLTKGNINISGFNNDSGFTTNVGDITGVTAGTNLTGGGTSGTVTLNMATGGVGSGTYGSTADGTKIDTITVDAYGRVTAVATGATGDILGVTAGTNLTGGGTSGTVTLNMATGGVGAGTYGSTADSTKIDTITVDAYGRVTAVATGATGDITGVTAGNGLTGGGTSGTPTLNVGAGTGVTVAADTVSIGQAVATSSDVQFNSIGVNTAGSGTAGQIRATGDITSNYSDARLKNIEGNIPDALAKVKALGGYYFTENQTAKDLGYDNDAQQVGVIAQEVEEVLPEAVKPAPIDEKYLTVQYEKLVPLLIEAIKELEARVAELEA